MQSFYQLYNESRKYRGTSWVAVFRRNPELEVLIGSRRENPTVRVLPGGRLDKGESGKDAALRELEEETGISLRDVKKCGKWGKKGYLYSSVIDKDVKLRPSDDIGGLRWYRIDNLPEMDEEHREMVMYAIEQTFKNAIDETYDLIPDAILNEEAKVDLKARLKEILKEKPRKQSGLLIAIEGIDGAGKCLGENTPVLMADGVIKMVQDVKVGDLVMGDDSKPRRVLNTHTGVDQMYRVTPNKGDSYTVNSRHILTLKVAGKNRYFNKYHNGEAIVEIPVHEYLEKSNCWKRHMLGYRALVDFPAKDVKIDPYFLGVWLGDGTSKKTEVTTADAAIVECVCNEAKSRNLKVTVEKQEKTAPAYRIVGHRAGRSNGNSLLSDLKHYNLIGNKHIPHDYKTNSREVRMQLLAGLMDTDGHACKKREYDFVNKNKVLVEDVAFLARSLGFAAYIKQCKKNCCNNGKVGVYYRVSIQGSCDMIPVRLPHKKCMPRKINKDVLKVGIKVEKTTIGRYYGFEVDGNHRFLLGDFTVVHNSTQIEELVDWLMGLNYDVVLTKWNSSEVMKKSIKKAKEKRLLTPLIFSLLHAADMAVRYEHEILPALEKNKIVIADRYIYTSLTRDKVRGVNVDMLKEIYKGFRVPDVVFRLKVPIEIAFSRVIRDKGLNYYSAGMDLNLSDNKEESCIKYEALVDKVYDEIMGEVPTCVTLDASKSIEQVQKKIRKTLTDKFGIGRYK